MGAIEGLRVRLLPARVDRGLARELWQIGWPAALDMVVLNIMLASIVGMIGLLGLGVQLAMKVFRRSPQRKTSRSRA